MSDIDFEELDRAVHSALRSSDSKDIQSPVLGNANNDTVKDHVEESNDSTDETTVDTASVVPAKKTLIQKRTTGRFMDVVHPSSDMRNQNKPTVSRQASDIMPPKDAAPFVKENEEPVPEENAVPASPVEEVPQVVEEDPHTLPDPLDFHNFDADTQEEEAVVSVEDVRSNKDELAEEDGELLEHDDEARVALDQVAGELSELDGLLNNQQEMPPLDTPFVNDLAVEKRPLGAFSIGNDHDLATEDDKAPEVDHEMSAALNSELADNDDEDREDANVLAPDVDAQTPAEAEVIPEELHEDVVAIESREIDMPSHSVPTTAPVPEAASAVVAGSIPQQYTEKPSTQSTDTTPVFDTNDYHQPLKHVEKKKSGWLIVILIVVFILLGVGAGAAIYFFDPFGLLQ